MTKRERGRPPIHPWSIWTNGEEHTLYRGKDFQSSLVSFRTMVHRKARDMAYVNRGSEHVTYKATTHINKADQSIRIQFHEAA